MSDNHFKPPEAELRDQQPRPGSPLRAILAGLVVDIGGSTLIGVLLSAGHAWYLATSGMSAEEIGRLSRDISPASPLAILAMLLGACCSVAGGYVCARIARQDEFRIGRMMAWLSAFFGVLLGGGETSVDMLILLSLSTIACVLLGVMYGRAANRRSEVPHK